jgi:magnesium transporter
MTDQNRQENLQEPIDRLYQALGAEDTATMRELLRAMHPFEIADIIEGLPGKARATVWGLIEPDMAGDVLSDLQETVRTELLHQMHPLEVAQVTSTLDTDDAADIVQDLPEKIKDVVLLSMDEQNRQRLASVLSYPEDTAGGLMNIDVVSVRADVSLDVVMRYLRLLGKIPGKTDTLMVVDRENKYLGVLSLAAILSNDPEKNVGEVMTAETGIPAHTHAFEVAKMFEQRDLFSAAVVDEKNMLLGRITVDDVVDVIQEEAEHTVRSMAGLGTDDMFAPVFTSTRRRAVWLGINLATCFLASMVIGQFERAIQQVVILAVLMPIVASMGGIAGSQTLTVAIRGIAMGQIGRANARALLMKELAVGFLNGLAWAAVVSAAVILWFHNWSVGIIIGVAMLTNLIVAALAGVIIPLIQKSFGIDPAIAGGVVLTTVTDVVGYMIFLGLATLFLLSPP